MYIGIACHILWLARVTSNKMTHMKRNYLLAWFSMPFHEVRYLFVSVSLRNHLNGGMMGMMLEIYVGNHHLLANYVILAPLPPQNWCPLRLLTDSSTAIQKPLFWWLIDANTCNKEDHTRKGHGKLGQTMVPFLVCQFVWGALGSCERCYCHLEDISANSALKSSRKNWFLRSIMLAWHILLCVMSVLLLPSR